MDGDQSRFRRKLAEQIGYLIRSCDAFDQGHTDEAYRIAVALRVMFRDGGRDSVSLLTHLNAWDIKLVTSGGHFLSSTSAKPMMAMGICATLQGPEGVRFVAPLDDVFGHDLVPAREWWTQVVMVLYPYIDMTREKIVLNAAETDGGAHVDAKLRDDYYRLTQGEITGDLSRNWPPGWLGLALFDDPRIQPAEVYVNAHLAALRQMAHEVLRSPDLRQLVPAT